MAVSLPVISSFDVRKGRKKKSKKKLLSLILLLFYDGRCYSKERHGIGGSCGGVVASGGGSMRGRIEGVKEAQVTPTGK